MSNISEFLINFIKNTTCENITAVTVVAELLTSYKLSKQEVKHYVENSIKSLIYFIDERKKNKLLELNLRVSKY